MVIEVAPSCVGGGHGRPGRRLGEEELADLAHARARQLVYQRDVTGAFRLRQPLRTPLVRARRCVGGAAGSAATTNATGTSSRTSSGAPTTAASSTAGWADEHLLDLDGGDVLAGDLEHVGAAAVEEEAAVGVAVGLVAGDEPAAAVGPVAEAGRGRRRVVEVAGEDRDAGLAADEQLLAVEVDEAAAPVGTAHRVGHADRRPAR